MRLVHQSYRLAEGELCWLCCSEKGSNAGERWGIALFHHTRPSTKARLTRFGNAVNTDLDAAEGRAISVSIARSLLRNLLLTAAVDKVERP